MFAHALIPLRKIITLHFLMNSARLQACGPDVAPGHPAQELQRAPVPAL